MADVESGDILRIGAGLSFEGVYDVVNVFHVLATLDAGINWGAVDNFVQTWLDDIYDNIKTLLNDSMGTNLISVANVTQLTTLGSIAWSPTWAGTGGGESTAAGVCCFGWCRTYKPRVQIRKYLGVFGETAMVDGVWASSLTDGVTAFMEAVRAETLMGTDKYFTGVAYNTALATYELGVSSDASAEPAYQRRRKRGRGS